MTTDDSSDTTTDGTGKMRARTWSIAANYRTPREYGIPTAPSFETEPYEDGTLRFLAADGSTVAVLDGEGHRVRR